MLKHDHPWTEAELEIRRLYRHTFLRDEDTRKALAVLLGQLGTWSSDPTPSPAQAALRGMGMSILEDLGVLHESREVALVTAITAVKPSEAEATKEGDS